MADHLITQDSASTLLTEASDALITEYNFGGGGSMMTLYLTAS